MPFDSRPIGVFDSGVGGLTVLQALRTRLPHESTVYLADTARIPYGTKSGQVVTRYALLNARFLRDQDIKLLVVACNTASAVALPALRAAFDIPVVGVIEPGARAAVAHTRSGRVGVICTPGTIRSGSYPRALHEARPGLEVHVQACPLFVPLAEEGWVSGDVPRQVARSYLAPLREAGVDTLVLGCTHYPLLKAVIAAEMGTDVELVDSAAPTAEEVASVLDRTGLQTSPGAARLRFYVTDAPDRFLETGGRFLGSPITAAEQVDLSLG